MKRATIRLNVVGAMMLQVVLLGSVQADLYVRNVSTLPIYMGENTNHTSWMAANLGYTTFKSAGGQVPDIDDGQWTMRMAGGNIAARDTLPYSFGDVITPPEMEGFRVDWAKMTNSSYNAAANDLVYVPSVNAAYFRAGGKIEITWHYVSLDTLSSTSVTQSMHVNQGPGTRPYRLYWTEAPHYGPTVSLYGKHVKFYFPESSAWTMSETITTNINDQIVTTNTPGLYIDDAQLLHAYGRIEGMCLMQYTKTGEGKEQVGINGGMIVVHVMPPDVSTLNIHLGDEISPRQSVYATAHGPLKPQMSSDATTDTGEPWYYTFAQEGEPDRHFAIRKTDDMPWNLACNWMGADLMGTEWPFEMNWYAADWDYAGAHTFICSTNQAYDPGIDTSSANVETMDYQEPGGHLTSDGTTVHADAKKLLSAEGQVGYSLLGISSATNISFLTLRSELYNSLRQWPVAEPEMIGNELLPQATAAALYFDGTEYAGASTQIDAATNSAFSVELWVYRAKDEGGHIIFVYDENLEQVMVDLDVDDEGSPCITLYDAYTNGYRSSPKSFLMHEQWYNLTLQVTSNAASLLVNGEYAGDTVTMPSGKLHGILPDPELIVGYQFQGMIDDIRVWRGLRKQENIQHGLDAFADWTDEPELMAYYPIMPDDATNTECIVRNYLASGNNQYDDLWYDKEGVALAPAVGAVGFTADPVRFPDDEGFVYEPEGDQYNAAFHNPDGNLGDDDGPIFAVDDAELNIWWREKVEVNGQSLYIPSVSQVFTNYWPETLRQIVLAAGNGSAVTSTVNAGRTMRILGGEGAGITVDRDLNVLGGNNEFTIECWYKPDRSYGTIPLMSFASNALVLYASSMKSNSGGFASALVYANSSGEKTMVMGPKSTADWNYLAVVVKGNQVVFYDNNMKGYTNFVSMASVETGPALHNRIGSLFYGDGESPADEVAREIDEIRLWNYARNPEQLAEKQRTQLTGNEAGLELYFSFEVSNSAEDAYDLAYKQFYPAEETLLVSPGAPRTESKVYASDEDIEVYVQNDADLPGVHLNDEHAFVHDDGSRKVVYALRDDLSPLEQVGDTNAENVVIVNVTRHEGDVDFYSMDLFEVVRTNEVYTQFLGHATAGAPLNGPSPLQLLPNWINEKTGLVYGPGFRDRKLVWWALAATDSNIPNEEILTMTNYYPMQEDFWFPGLTADQQPALNTPIPWLPTDPTPAEAVARGFSADYPTRGTPIEYNWEVTWPSDVPQMKIGQTLTKATGGLPEMWNQESVDVLWQTSTNHALGTSDEQQGESVLLFDPTVARGFGVLDGGPEAYGFKATGGSPSIYTYKGLTYFSELPPDLKERVYYDPTASGSNLFLKGEYMANPAGDDWLYVNVLSTAQVSEIMQLASDSYSAAWQGMLTSNSIYALTNPVPALPNTPVDHFALAALGEGAGYVTVAFNNSTNTDMVPEGDLVTLEVIHVDTNLYLGKIMPIEDEIDLLNEEMNMLYTESMAGRADQFEFEWKFAPEKPSGVIETNVNNMTEFAKGTGLTRLLLGGGSDANFEDQVNRMFTLRYRALPGAAAEVIVGTNWSDYVNVALSEGWIQRVLNALTPFEQRMRDLYDNPVETDVTMIQQAGPPYEGDVALNMNNMNDIGLMQLYRTLQNVAGSMYTNEMAGSMSTNEMAAAAQKQLLLTASRLNDLYMVLGDEAFVDAMDPTIQYGYSMTADGASFDLDYDTYAGSLFCFENQVANLLEEELALLRGRNGGGVLQPPVSDGPYFNRLPWNFTKGLMAGEVAYAMNYNIRGADQPIIDEETAAELFPQGHGDAWGYYQMAVKQYRDLLRNPFYTLGPGMTAMDLGGNPVNVAYHDENKCAESAAALARTGREILRRARRKGYAECGDSLFPGLLDSNTNRAWGVGEWAARAGQGAYLNWLMVNSMLPQGNDITEMTEDQLTNITRQTTAGLGMLKTTYADIQQEIDSADARLNPLGLSDDSIPFDISPARIDAGETHFEQIMARAEQSLENAGKALGNAQKFSLTRRRNQENGYSLAEELADEESAWERRLIEIYGYPYSDDIGPGKTYVQGYDGPDLFHWMYMNPEIYYIDDTTLSVATFTYDLDTKVMTIKDDNMGVHIFADATLEFAGDLLAFKLKDLIKDVGGANIGYGEELALAIMNIGIYVYDTLDSYSVSEASTHNEITFAVRSDGLPVTPTTWTGSRRAEGELQAACADFLVKYRAQGAKRKAMQKVLDDLSGEYNSILTSINMAIAKQSLGYFHEATTKIKSNMEAALQELVAKTEAEMAGLDSETATAEEMSKLQIILGMAGSVNAPQVIASSSVKTYQEIQVEIKKIKEKVETVLLKMIKSVDAVANSEFERYNTYYETREMLTKNSDAMEAATKAVTAAINDYKSALIDLQQAQQKIYTLLAEGERVQEERERVRLQQAQQVASLRYADMLMRVFQNDAIRQYQSLFDRAAQQAYLAAKAYAYETAMSATDQQLDPGYEFLNQIIQARTVGALDDEGNPIASGDIGDGGLANILARLKSNWAVLDGRLGFNNPEVETGRFSLRQELFRILPGADGDEAWQRTLRQYWVEDLYAVPEFSAQCIPFDSGEQRTEPGLVIPFSSDVTFGRNFFGKDLAGGDNAYDSSHFATKIRSLGIWFSDYNTGTNFNGLANNPRVYLVPAGQDYMRTPDQLAGESLADDGSALCAWNVIDQVLDLPYPIGDTELNDKNWIPLLNSSAGSLYRTRRYPSLRAYHDDGDFDDSEMISNARLIGRSVWNTRWLLIIPAGTLNTDREKGLDYFIDGIDGSGGVSDIKLMFKTYSYAGN